MISSKKMKLLIFLLTFYSQNLFTLLTQSTLNEPSSTLVNHYLPNYTRYSWHWTAHLSYDGKKIILEDGSQWEISPKATSKILSWNPDSPLLIMQNDAWCTSYEYRLFNKSNYQSVEINLLTDPVVGGPHTHKISTIDYHNGELMLEDGTRWMLHKDDEYYSKDWQINDIVIVGNNVYKHDTDLHILINVKFHNYSRASLL